MRLSLLCLLMGLLCTGARAQCPTNLVITNDQDVINFTNNFPSCTALPGNLEVNGPNVTDISALAVLDKIGGGVLISKVDMIDIKGLENIISIGEDFTITDCLNLSGNGFSPRLALQSIGGFLFINNLPNLTGFPPLDNLGILSSGFGSNATNILDLAPLAGVTGGMERVILTNNPLLRDLNGLGNVETISTFKAKGNGGLKEIEELLQSPKDTLELTDNPQLPSCATDGVCGALANENTYVLISDNGINCSSTAAVQAICNNCHPDYEALVAIYNAANGDDWTNNTNWLENCDVCTWFGVTCDANDRVERLELPNNNLVGTLANEVRDLTEVKWLRFNNNSFTGGVPNLIPLDKLERLRLHRAGFSGNLPILGNKQNLTHLELYDNDFVGSIPGSYSGSRFPALRFLYLDRNELTGTPPTSIATMTNLEEFNVHTNNLTGCYPTVYSNLCGLNSILFFNNAGLPDGGSTDFFTNEFCANGTACAPCDHPDFEGLMEFYDATNGAGWTDNSGWADGAAGDDCEPCTWFGITCDANDRVTEIRLPTNNLTGIIPAQVSLLTALKVLQVPFNGIGGELPDALWFNDLLEEVYVQNNDIGGQFPDIGNHPGLRVVGASNNDFFGQIPIVGNIPNMIRMTFANCDFTAEIPAGYNPTNMPLLNQFNVQGNAIFAELPEGLGAYPDGQLNINLASNNFVGCYPANYASFCGETFRFEGNTQLPDGGSENFFADVFCDFGVGCPLDCHPDYEALAALYVSTNGDNWTRSTGWLTDCDVCDWEGVSCSAQGRVISLNLGGNNLDGVLPAEIGGLTNISTLGLSVNSISGSLPNSMGNLTLLNILAINDNDLTGGLPAFLGSLPLLRTLNIYNNELGGSIPAELGNATSLVSLDLRNNGLTGTPPSSLGQLVNLVIFSIGNNELTGALPKMDNQPELDRYNVSSNLFSGEVPASLVNSSVITNIALADNQLDGDLPELFGNLPTLTQLFLQGNQFSGCYPANYSNLCGDNTNFTNNPDLPDGGSDDFFENTFCVTGETCDGPCHPDYDALVALYNAADGGSWTNDNGWADGAEGNDCDVCDWFGVFCNTDGRVTAINLIGNNLIGSLPDELGDIDFLQGLNLSGHPNLTGPVPPSLFELGEISSVVLVDNDHTGGIPGNIGNAVTLQVLQFNNSNNLGGAIPAGITALINLEVLTLPSCGLTGPLPTDLSDLAVLNFLQLSNNEFSGNLPASLGTLTALTELYLQGNNFDGELPPELADLTALTDLLLNNNDFSGCYPAEYSALCGLDRIEFGGNVGLPDEGSDDFFENTFCVSGQTCEEDCPVSLTINSTQDITDYMAQYPNCTVLQGNLIINGVNIQTGNLNNRLDTVYGDVQVRNLTTTSAPGFQGIRYIGNDFIVEDCPNLGTNGFGGTMQLNTVGRDVRITDLPTIQTISPLVNLESVGRTLAITRTAISTLDGLQGLAGTVPILRIQDNDQLTDLTALANLTARGPALEQVSALVINENDILASLDGLDGFVVPGSMNIQENASLSTCEAETVCAKIAADDNLVFIMNNAAGCNSVPEVETACNVLPVTWQSFNATAAPKWVALDWSTSAETNNAYFGVERSATGRIWTEIGQVAPTANQTYTYKDTEPLVGESYYRLRQVDYDGAFSFSVVRRVNFVGTTALAWPNPAGEEFNLYSAIPQQIEVFDLTGSRVQTIQHLGGGAQVQRKLDKQGVYLLRFMTSGETLRLILK